jgi:hypothetical protein
MGVMRKEKVKRKKEKIVALTFYFYLLPFYFLLTVEKIAPATENRRGGS